MGGWNPDWERAAEGSAVIPAIYLENNGEWLDAGDYDLKLTAKFATLQRTRKPAACLPGAIDHSDKARIARADWDAGRRRIYPHREGVPMIFLAAGVKDWKPQDDTITQKDIAAFF